MSESSSINVKRVGLFVGGGILAVLVAMVLAVVMFVMVLFGGSSAAGAISACDVDESSASSPVGAWTPAQLGQAKTIIAVGREIGVSDRGLTIALMVAMQESGIKNRANPNVPESMSFPHEDEGTDHDSVNAFQQRPSSGWGTVEQLMTPKYAAAAFFGGPTGPNRGSPRGLLDIAGWEKMPLGVAAQTVQVSAFPEAYDKWEKDAKQVLKGAGGSVSCSPSVPGKAPGDDYPWPTAKPLDAGGVFSPLNYGYRECTDFVAWRLNRDAGASKNGPWPWTWSELTPGGGNAIQWKPHWERRGWEVSKNPRVGWVAWWGESASQWGHVAYVQAVRPDGQIVIEEYNFGFNHAYHTRVIAADQVDAYLAPPPKNKVVLDK